MKIGIGIISLGWMILVFFQSCAAGLGGAIGNDEVTRSAGQMGMFIGVAVFLIGGAFAFALPLVSAVVFLLGALVFMNLDHGSFKDLAVHGWVMLFFGIATALIYLKDRKKKRTEPANQLE